MNIKAKALKSKVTNAVGSALSAPYRMKQAHRKSGYDRDVKTLKTARAYDDAPNFDGKGVTPAYKARFMAEMVRQKHKGGVK